MSGTIQMQIAVALACISLLWCSALQASAGSLTSTWLGGAGAWMDPTKWNNGVPQDTPADTYTAAIDGGNAASSRVILASTATVTGFALDVGDSLMVNPGGQLTVVGTQFRNSGEILLAGIGASGSTDSLVIYPVGGGPSVSGGGSIRLEGGSPGAGVTGIENHITR